MVPLSKNSDGVTRDGWIISDSWYIGAFGKWWRGGVFEEWYQDVIARSKDEESWSSGIISMKRLDMLQDYHGMYFFIKTRASHLLKSVSAPTFSAKNLHLRGSPPRLRNRERPALRNASVHARSLTPPPLPKSASLPMHTVRKTPSNGTRLSDRASQVQLQPHAQPGMSTDGARRVLSGPSRSSSTLFEHSPLITEVLRQITASKASVLDLRSQLTECQTAASQSHAVLQHEVDSHRDRKRQEDASKGELKLRTKTLEDSKRAAEGLKKEAEKKLKSVQSLRDGASQRMEHLDHDIVALQKSLSDDRDFISNHRIDVSQTENDIAEALELKRQEIKAAEELILVLNQRSREIEDKLSAEKDRLKILREKSDDYKQRRANTLEQYQQYLQHAQDAWSPAIQPESQQPTLHNGDRWDIANGALNGHGSQLSSLYDSQLIPDDRVYPNDTLGLPTAHDSLTSSGFNENSYTLALNGHADNAHPTSEDSGIAHPYYNDDFVAPAQADDDSMLSRSFQSDSDPYVEKDWRHNTSYTNQYTDDSRLTSPISLHGPSINNPGGSSEDVHFSSSHDYGYDHLQSPAQLQRSNWMRVNDNLDIQDPDYAFPIQAEKPASRTWFSGMGRSSKGLNPDAKEFNIFRPRNFLNQGRNSLPTDTTATFDALNPNGLGTGAPTSANRSLLRAFAPSPAEREALQRALGGSTNASFERLPSLSDVGSIPASPTAPHAVRPHLPPPSPGHNLGSILPAWLQALPRTRKVNFSPWDDEEPQASRKDIVVKRG